MWYEYDSRWIWIEHTSATTASAAAAASTATTSPLWWRCMLRSPASVWWWLCTPIPPITIIVSATMIICGKRKVIVVVVIHIHLYIDWSEFGKWSGIGPTSSTIVTVTIAFTLSKCFFALLVQFLNLLLCLFCIELRVYNIVKPTGLRRWQREISWMEWIVEGTKDKYQNQIVLASCPRWNCSLQTLYFPLFSCTDSLLVY